MLMMDLSQQDISYKLGIKVSTVSNHKRNIADAWGLKSIADLKPTYRSFLSIEANKPLPTPDLTGHWQFQIQCTEYGQRDIYPWLFIRANLARVDEMKGLYTGRLDQEFLSYYGADGVPEGSAMEIAVSKKPYSNIMVLAGCVLAGCATAHVAVAEDGGADIDIVLKLTIMGKLNSHVGEMELTLTSDSHGDALLCGQIKSINANEALCNFDNPVEVIASKVEID